MTRSVIFQLTARLDPANGAAFKALGDTAADVQKGISAGWERVTAGLQTQLRTQEASLRELAKQASSESVAGAARPQLPLTAPSPASSPAVQAVETEKQALGDLDSLKGRLAEIEASRQAESLKKFAEMEAERLRIVLGTEDAIQKAMAEFENKTGGPLSLEQRAQIEVGVRKKVQAEVEKIDAQIAAAREKEALKARAAEERSIKATIRDREKQAESEKRQQEALVKASEAAKAKIAGANREMLQTAAELGEGVMKVGRGFVALGLIGEKDLDKVKDRLLLMQGAFDLVSGSIQTFLKISKAIEAMKVATAAATVVQEAQNAAQARNVVITNAQAAAQTRLAGATGAAATAGAAQGGLSTLGGLRSLAAGGAGRLAGAAGTVLPIAALVTAIVGLKDVIAGGGKFKEGSLSHTASTMGVEWGGSMDHRLGLKTVYSEAHESKLKTARMEKAREVQLEQIARQDKQIEGASSQIGQALAGQTSVKDPRLEAELETMKAQEKSKRIIEEIAAEEESILKLKEQAAQYEGRFGSIRQEFTAAAEEGEKRVLGLLARRREAEREVGREKIKAAEESLRLSEKELDVAKSKAEEAQQSLLSAQERFGLMDQGEQQQLKESARKLKAGEDLAPEQLRKLQGLGLDSVNESVKKQALEKAKAAGFDDIAAQDAEQVKALQAKQAELEVTVADKRNIITTVEQDTEKIVAEIQKQILEKVQANDEVLANKLAQALAQMADLDKIIKNGGGGR